MKFNFLFVHRFDTYVTLDLSATSRSPRGTGAKTFTSV
jgi:hypothetical protein